jgi:hypothetical protein
MEASAMQVLPPGFPKIIIKAGEHWWKHRYDFYFPPYTLTLP